ncbi:MAG: imidazole glycerol phosphate synthase subunit HisH, partial [Cutibacterium avidum]|nr:imidazole glycerol phosphate synthase subunit HisH [Cutibacterium avidum]
MPGVSPAPRVPSMSDPVRVGIIDHGSGNLHSAG